MVFAELENDDGVILVLKI